MDRKYIDHLYDRFSAGARFRASVYFFYKKYSWATVIKSAYIFKRLLDIAGSFALLTVLSPLFLFLAIGIKIEDRGPVFYSQTRVGKWGRLFTMYKFRSMVLDADRLKNELLDRNESDGVIFKMSNDPRITRVGKVMRRFSMDELPQFWNVLRGDMSLVGPRPPLPNEVSEYDYSDRKRLDVVPGLTCIWQVSGRSEINFRGQVRLDVQYIDNQSFWMDIKILFKTVWAVLSGRGAY